MSAFEDSDGVWGDFSRALNRRDGDAAGSRVEDLTPTALHEASPVEISLEYQASSDSPWRFIWVAPEAFDALGHRWPAGATEPFVYLRDHDLGWLLDRQWEAPSFLGQKSVLEQTVWLYRGRFLFVEHGPQDVSWCPTPEGVAPYRAHVARLAAEAGLGEPIRREELAALRARLPDPAREVRQRWADFEALLDQRRPASERIRLAVELGDLAGVMIDDRGDDEPLELEFVIDTEDADGSYRVPAITEFPTTISKSAKELGALLDQQWEHPVLLGTGFEADEGETRWVYRGRVIRVWTAGTRLHHPAAGAVADAIAMLLRHSLSDVPRDATQALRALRVRLPGEPNPAFAAPELRAHRPYIPQDVRVFVWRRDQGRCSECGSREKLEFDHVIPVAEGGSSTARNLRLLCEECNRRKGSRI